MGKTKVNKLSALLQNEGIDMIELIEMTFHDNKNTAFRAAWLLENILLKKPGNFLTCLPAIISRINEVTNPSCKRHYAKILMHLTAKKAPQSIKDELAKIDLTPAIEQCFDWLIDPKILVAVKAFAAEALFNMGHRYAWITDELSEQLNYLMRDGTAAIQSKGKRLLTALAHKEQ